MVERQVRDLEIEEALQDEIKDTLEHNNHSYVYWCALSDEGKNNNKVNITVTYGMGWHKRSSGRRNESSIEACLHHWWEKQGDHWNGTLFQGLPEVICCIKDRIISRRT